MMLLCSIGLVNKSGGFNVVASCRCVYGRPHFPARIENDIEISGMIFLGRCLTEPLSLQLAVETIRNVEVEENGF